MTGNSEQVQSQFLHTCKLRPRKAHARIGVEAKGPPLLVDDHGVQDVLTGVDNAPPGLGVGAAANVGWIELLHGDAEAALDGSVGWIGLGVLLYLSSLDPTRSRPRTRSALTGSHS